MRDNGRFGMGAGFENGKAMGTDERSMITGTGVGKALMETEKPSLLAHAIA